MKNIIKKTGRIIVGWMISLKLKSDREKIDIPNHLVDMYYMVHRVYFRRFRSFPNIVNPRSYNEKIQWIKIFDQNPIMAKCADKYEVREYIESKGLGHILVKLYGCYENFDDIDFDVLPESFVLKVSHLSGGVFLFPDKTKLQVDELREKVNKCLAHVHGIGSGEWVYEKMRPRIIIEEYLGDPSGNPPADYKLHCGGGQIGFIQYICDRNVGVREIILTANWEKIDLRFDTNFKVLDIAPERIANLDEILGIARKLSEDFKYVRVDLYNVNNKVYFGELTFFPMGGFYPTSDIKELGDLIPFDPALGNAVERS
jgi:hypothetical protein